MKKLKKLIDTLKTKKPCIFIEDCHVFLPGDRVVKAPGSKDRELKHGVVYTVEKCLTMELRMEDWGIPRRDIVFLLEFPVWCFRTEDLMLVQKDFSEEWTELEKVK